MFSQDNGLWRDTGDPWNSWRVISVAGKKKRKVRFKTFLCISSQVCILVVNVCVYVCVYGGTPMIHPPICLRLLAWLSPLLPQPAPLTLCPALSRTPVISWGRGNRHHGLSSHPSSCTWPLLSPRAPLLQRTTCQRERIDRGQVGETAERERREQDC